MGVTVTKAELRAKQWSSKFFKYGMNAMYFSKFIGEYKEVFDPRKGDGRVTIMSDPNAIIQVKMDLMSKIGDTITYPLIAPLAGHGRVQLAAATGVTELEGNEEAIANYDWSTTLKQWAHGVIDLGPLSRKQPAFDWGDTQSISLAMWYARELDRLTYRVMAGLAYVDDGGTIELASLNPHLGTGRILAGGMSTADQAVNYASLDASIVGDEVMCLEFVRRAATMARANEPIIRPIVINGEEFYCMFMSPEQMDDLQTNAGGSTGSTWLSIQRDANVRGDKNPIFRGSAGIYAGVILFEYAGVESRVGAGGSTAAEYFDLGDDCASGVTVHRALLCGAGAGVHAYGALPKIVRKKFQYDTQHGASLQTMLSVGKPQFNSVDYGVMVVDTSVS